MRRTLIRGACLAIAAAFLPACGFRMAEPPQTEKFPEGLLGTFIQRGGDRYTEYLHIVRDQDDAQMTCTRVQSDLEGGRTWLARARKVKGKDVLLVHPLGADGKAAETYLVYRYTLEGDRLRHAHVQYKLVDRAVQRGLIPGRFVGGAEGEKRADTVLDGTLDALLARKDLPWYPEETAYRFEPDPEWKQVRAALHKANPKWSGSGTSYQSDRDGRLVELHLTGSFADLSALSGVKLVRLSLNSGEVADLTPLKGMPLEALSLVSCSGIRDLAPLSDAPLRELNLAGSGVADLTPLRTKSLEWLALSRDFKSYDRLKTWNLKVLHASEMSDLSPLKGLALQKLTLHEAEVADLAPLAGMPLEEFQAKSPKLRSLEPLRGMPLRSLDLAGCSAVTDLEPLRTAPLASVSLDGTSVKDLGPLSGKALWALTFRGAPVEDLSPLKGMKFEKLDLGGTSVSDLSPLKGMRLEELGLRGTKVRDIAPLKGMPLYALDLSETPVTDLEPLRGMQLSSFNLSGTKVSDLGPLEGMKLSPLDLRKTPELRKDPLPDFLKGTRILQ